MTQSMQELMEQKIWILWKWMARKNSKGEVVNTKVPIALDGSASGTNEKWQHTWASYAEAATAKEKLPGAAGLGFVVPKGCFFLDMDDVALTHPEVKALVDRFHSYTELSVSGHGIHIYGKCSFEKLPIYQDEKQAWHLKPEYYINNRKAGLELYLGGVTNHFAAITGNAVLDVPLQECTEALLRTLEKDMRKKTADSDCERNDKGEQDAVRVIEALRGQKNGPKFCKLFDEGDTGAYGSDSEADAALAALIAFRTGPDPEAIREIMFRSALRRKKWEREDYITATINAGIRACNGNFIHPKEEHSIEEHPYFIEFTKKGEPYIQCALLAKWTREHLTYVLVRDNGKQALNIFVYENGVYRLYAPEMLQGAIKSYIMNYDERLVNMQTVQEVYKQLTTDLKYVPQEALNAKENVINFQNGLLTVTADRMSFSEHDRNVLSTIQIPCKWTNRPVPTPVFDNYINTLTNGDRDVAQLLLEFMGVALSNIKGYRMKKSLFMVGAGDTGKSQLKSLTEHLLGSGNYMSIDLKEIEARFGTGAIYGTRLAGSSDMSFLSVDELKTFKCLTGGDSVFAEFKGQQGFQYTYNGLMWFCMNKLPKFGGDDGKWVYERILVVNCPNVIPKNQQDKCLLDKMYEEREGILYKCILALQKVIANGYRFDEPEGVSAAREKYMCENSTVISFFEECMTKRKDKIEKTDNYTTRKVYQVYKNWCRDNNNGYGKTEREFRESLAEHVGSTVDEMRVQRKKGTYYKDYTVSEDGKRNYDEHYYSPYDDDDDEDAFLA